MNKTLQLRSYLRGTHKEKQLMEFSDHEGMTRCHRCRDIEKNYTYIPVLGGIYVCDKCGRKWDRWGLAVFKEMIGFE